MQTAAPKHQWLVLAGFILICLGEYETGIMMSREAMRLNLHSRLAQRVLIEVPTPAPDASVIASAVIAASSAARTVML